MLILYIFNVIVTSFNWVEYRKLSLSSIIIIAKCI